MRRGSVANHADNCPPFEINGMNAPPLTTSMCQSGSFSNHHHDGPTEPNAQRFCDHQRAARQCHRKRRS